MLVADLSVAFGQDPQGGGRAALGTGLAGRQMLRNAPGVSQCAVSDPRELHIPLTT